MPVKEVREIHGLREPSIIRRYCRGFPDEPLTEEQKEHNREVERSVNLSSLQLKLCCLLDDKFFVAESLNFVTSKVFGMKVQNTRPKFESINTGEESPSTEEIKIVKTRLRDAILTYHNDIETLRMLNRSLIHRAFSRPKDYPESDTPELLYRAFKSSCHGRHGQDLGFRSSRQPLTSFSYHNGTLLDSSLVDKDALRNLCGGDQPSDLISLSDGPSRILKFIKGWGFHDRKGDIIAVISVSKLLAMGVLFNRTTALANSLGMDLRTGRRPLGLEYANSNFWVAYRWVPAECTECYISENFLQKACDSHGIGAWPSLFQEHSLIGTGKNDFVAQFSLDEILSLKKSNPFHVT